MTLLALDQASRVTGYALFKDNKLVKFGKFNLTSDDIGERLVDFREHIVDFIENQDIDEVVFEDIQQQNNVANNVQTFKILAEVYGVLLEVLTGYRVKHSSVLAASWKSTLGIKGRTRPEQKRNAQQYVEDNYGVKATQDECDAICIGAAHILSKKSAWD